MIGCSVDLFSFKQKTAYEMRISDWSSDVCSSDLGISDDTDLTQQWPGLALMGVDPDKINASLHALSEAAYRNGMHTDGLATITTDEPIGRASGRERVCQYVTISVVAVSLKKNI